MLTANHPNAEWLSAHYQGLAAIARDASLDTAQRQQRMAAHAGKYLQRVSRNFIMHTGGARLAAVGDLAFTRAYVRRRGALCDISAPIKVNQVLADDQFGIVHMVHRTARGENVLDRVAMSAWRFEHGLAVEHWELANGPEWDAFFLTGDATFQPDDASEFWTKA